MWGKLGVVSWDIMSVLSDVFGKLFVCIGVVKVDISITVFHRSAVSFD